MGTETSNVVVAMRVAAQWLRKQTHGRSLLDFVQDEMQAAGIPDNQLDAMQDLVNAFLAFSDAVRVADRHNTQIIPYLGENIPSRR